MAGIVTHYENMILKDDVFAIHSKGIPFLEVRFDEEEDFWNGAPIDNYCSRLTISRNSTLHDRPCIIVEGGPPRDANDTAWVLRSVKTPYNGQAGRVAINVDCSASMSLEGLSGNNHNCYVAWLDEDDKLISQTPFVLGGTANGFTSIQTIGEIPEGTKAFYILFGFDWPNINPGHFCAFSKLTLEYLPAEPLYADSAFFETAPIKLAGQSVSWKGKTPEGTHIYLQTSLADDVDGCPADWSPFVGPNGKEDTYYEAPFTVSKPWVRLRVEFRSNGSKHPELEEMIIGDSHEKYWKNTSLLQNPIVENLTVSPTHDLRNPLVLRLSCANAPIKWSTFSAVLDGNDITADFVKNGDTMTYIPSQDYAEGRHELKVHIENGFGMTTDSNKLFVIGNGPNVDKITVREDGMTLINGTPFFPIGAYAVSPREFNENSLDKAFKDLSDAGFNFVHTYGSNSKEFLDGAHKYGLRVWARAFDLKEMNDLMFNHPAILAWYVGDDTSAFTTPARLQDVCDALKAVDNRRLTVQADGSGITRHSAGPMDAICLYQRFARATDYFLPEIYPVREDTQEDRENCVPTVIRDMQGCINSINSLSDSTPKGIWAIIQYFEGWSSWKRFPTEDELRAMSYAAIVHGATGIVWYTYGGFGDNHGMTSTPERWAAMTRLTAQLRELTPILVEEKTKTQPVVVITRGKTTDAKGYPSVTCLMKRHDGKNYVIAVNSSLDTVTASLRIDDAKNATVIFENREIPLNDGNLIDEFAPLAVHVYRLD